MTLILELPQAPESILRRFDARWKLAAVLLSIAAIVPLRKPGPVILAAFGVFLLAFVARMPWRGYSQRLFLLFPFLAGIAALLPFVLHGEGASWQIGPIRFSIYGLLIACRIAAKILAILTLVLVLLATTSLPTLLKAAHALHIPGFLIQLTALTWRYLFLVIEEFARIRTALRVRGYRNRVSLHNYGVIGNVVGVMLVRGAERAERVGHAMRCRGFDGQFRSLDHFQTARRDVLLFLLIMTVAAALLSWQWLS